MQDTNWSQIEWELLSEEIELSPPWKADHFFNTFRLDMDGIYKIQIWRDEEYMLRAKLIGNCVITDQGDEGALERGVIVQSDLKGVWDYSYSAKLIQCFPELATTNYLLQEDRTAVECTMGISHIKVKPHKSLPKQKRESLVEWCLNAPTSTVLYVDSTERKVKTKLQKKRDMCEDSYIPNRQSQNSRDTVYIFWTVVVGLTCGVGDYITAGIGSAIVFLILLVLGRIKNESRMLLIVRGARSTDKRIMSIVSEYFSRRIDLRVENTTEQTVELIYEIPLKIFEKASNRAESIADCLYEIEHVEYVNVVAQDDDISN